MPIEALAGMVFSLIVIAMIGGFILLFPVSRRLGSFLEVWIQEKKKELDEGGSDTALLQRTIQALEEEVGRLAERQQFTERLLESRSSASSSPNAPDPP